MAVWPNSSLPVGHPTADLESGPLSTVDLVILKEKLNGMKRAMTCAGKAIRTEKPMKAGDAVIVAEGSAKGQYGDRQSCS